METSVLRSILVPLDGSASADAAFGLALRLAAPSGEVIVVHVINRNAVIAECVTPYGGDALPALDALAADEREIFARASALAHAAGVKLSTLALDGPPAACIARAARTRGVDAIAMGTHGRRGLARIVLGNTAAGVLHDTDLPTFVVHEASAAKAAAPFREVLVALDASEAASNAARLAVDLASRDDGRVFLAHVVEHDAGEAAQAQALAEAASYALTSGVAADSAELHGDPVDALLIAAETRHANLIAIGAQGRASGPFRMGSVAESIVRTSPVPVLVVPAPATVSAPPRTGALRASAHEPRPV